MWPYVTPPSTSTYSRSGCKPKLEIAQHIDANIEVPAQNLVTACWAISAINALGWMMRLFRRANPFAEELNLDRTTDVMVILMLINQQLNFQFD